MKIKVKDLLHFFDEEPPDSQHHTSAIVGVMGEDLGIALLQNYFLEESGIKTEVLMKDPNTPETPSHGTNKGHRLDRWLLEKAPNGKRVNLYQVEIKNWSAHAIGGKKLEINADQGSLKTHRIRSWNNKWDQKRKRFKGDSMEKVLEIMVIPKGQKGPVKVTPVICFWDAVHPEGKPEALFEYSDYSFRKKDFPKFLVFSMSNYLRSFRKKVLELHMPTAEQRIKWIQKLAKP